MNALSSLQKKMLISFLMFGISLWHYTTSIHHPIYHMIHRELYLIPIVLAAYWFGKKGGLTVSVIASALFLPWAFQSAHVTTVYHVNNVAEIIMFNGIAYLLGIYRDAKKAHFTRFWQSKSDHPTLTCDGRNVLVCIDNSQNTLKAPLYVANNFPKDDRTTVTILGFIREPQEDLFAGPKEYGRARTMSEEAIGKLVQEAQRILQEGGFAPEAVKVKAIRLQKESIGARLLEEQQHIQCASIVVGGTRMSKTEEFIFGNLAINLVRESDCPVVTVY